MLRFEVWSWRLNVARAPSLPGKPLLLGTYELFEMPGLEPKLAVGHQAGGGQSFLRRIFLLVDGVLIFFRASYVRSVLIRARKVCMRDRADEADSSIETPEGRINS